MMRHSPEFPALAGAIMPLKTAVVLIVEDSALILLNALDLVAAAGFEGLGAANSDEAIAILEARVDIRLVFTDVEMPGAIDGVELAHYIRNRWPPVQLIVASGTMIEAENELPDGSRFFPKPYDGETVIGEISRMLAGTEPIHSGHR